MIFSQPRINTDLQDRQNKRDRNQPPHTKREGTTQPGEVSDCIDRVDSLWRDGSASEVAPV
ncbi:MAG: hypothetical protein AAGC54_09820 [Cyanobacteria bacterium P01_F01_bin.4]